MISTARSERASGAARGVRKPSSSVACSAPTALRASIGTGRAGARGCAVRTASKSLRVGGASIGRGAHRSALNNSYSSGSSSRMELPDLGARLDERAVRRARHMVIEDQSGIKQERSDDSALILNESLLKG